MYIYNDPQLFNGINQETNHCSDDQQFNSKDVFSQCHRIIGATHSHAQSRQLQVKITQEEIEKKLEIEFIDFINQPNFSYFSVSPIDFLMKGEKYIPPT